MAKHDCIKLHYLNVPIRVGLVSQCCKRPGRPGWELDYATRADAPRTIGAMATDVSPSGAGNSRSYFPGRQKSAEREQSVVNVCT